MFALHFENAKKDNALNQIQRIILIGMYSEEIKVVLTNLNFKICSKFPLQKDEAGRLNNFFDVPTPPPRVIV